MPCAQRMWRMGAGRSQIIGHGTGAHFLYFVAIVVPRFFEAFGFSLAFAFYAQCLAPIICFHGTGQMSVVR